MTTLDLATIPDPPPRLVDFRREDWPHKQRDTGPADLLRRREPWRQAREQSGTRRRTRVVGGRCRSRSGSALGRACSEVPASAGRAGDRADPWGHADPNPHLAQEVLPLRLRTGHELDPVAPPSTGSGM